MGEYDKVIKENIEAIFLPLLEKFTGINVVSSHEIKDKIQKTVEREPDFLKKIVDQHGKQSILQLEFQTQDDAEMVYRMAEYKALLQRKYRLPVQQFVIYLGTKKTKMRTMLTDDEQITGFELRNIQHLSPDSLTQSQIPEEIILSILSNYSKTDTDKVIASIITKLQALATSKTELDKYLKQLMILSRLRKLEVETRKKVDDMPITYDITTDGLYKQGIQQGIEQGMERGIEQGIEQGMKRGTSTTKKQAVIKALGQNVLTLEQIADMLEVSVDFILEIKSQIDEK